MWVKTGWSGRHERRSVANHFGGRRTHQSPAHSSRRRLFPAKIRGRAGTGRRIAPIRPIGLADFRRDHCFVYIKDLPHIIRLLGLPRYSKFEIRTRRSGRIASIAMDIKEAIDPRKLRRLLVPGPRWRFGADGRRHASSRKWPVRAPYSRRSQ